MALVKYVLLLPQTYNDKTRVPRRILNRFLEALFRLAGGYTIAGTTKGAYRMASGKKQVDSCLEVWVLTEEADAALLKKLVANLGAELKQESMYFERVQSTVDFIPPSSNGR